MLSRLWVLLLPLLMGADWILHPEDSEIDTTPTAVRAFPGAEGPGCDTVHGRGGTVIKVTNGNDSGAGSLRACAETSGPRFCIFEYGGNIELRSRLVFNGNVYVAGQTAPQQITIKNYATVPNGDNILIRHMRFATGTDNPTDTRGATAPFGDNYCLPGAGSCPVTGTDQIGHTLLIRGTQFGAASTDDICIYHSEFLWGWERLFSAGDNNNRGPGASAAANRINRITIARSIFAEPLQNAPSPNDYFEDPSTQASATIAVVGPFVQDVAFLRNIMHGTHRTPLNNTGAKVLSINNRVGPNNFFNAGYQHNNEPTPRPDVQFTAIANKLRVSASQIGTSYDRWYRTIISGVGSQYYGFGNDLPPTTTEAPGSTIVASPISDITDVTILNAGEVDDYTLNNAGMWPGSKDAISSGVISNINSNTNYYSIDCPRASQCTNSSVGYISTSSTRTLNVPANPHDDDDGDGYTNIEEWLEGFAETVEGRDAP